MRMMSAECLASGTDPVRLSAKGVEDRGKERARDERQERQSVREQEKNGDRCQNTITL